MRRVDADIELRRAQRQELSDKLYSVVNPKLTILKNTCVSVAVGVAIGAILLDGDNQTGVTRVVFFTSIAIFFIHKFLAKEMVKDIDREIENQYPHQELYPDSSIYDPNSVDYKGKK